MPDINDQQRTLQGLLNTMNDFSVTMAATMDMMNEKTRQFIEVSDKLVERWGTMADDAKSFVAHVDQMEKGFTEVLRMVGKLKGGIFNQREVRYVREDFEKIAKAAKQILDDEGRTANERHRARQTLDAMTRSLEKLRDVTAVTPKLAGELRKELEGVEGTLGSIRREMEKTRSAFDAVGSALRDTFGNVRLFEPFTRFFDKYRRLKETGESIKKTAEENIKRRVEAYQVKAAGREDPLQELLHRIPVTPRGKIDKKALQSMGAEQRAEVVRAAQEVEALRPKVLEGMVERFRGTPKGRQRLAQGIREAAGQLVREGGPVGPLPAPPGPAREVIDFREGAPVGERFADAARASETAAGKAAEAAATGASAVAEAAETASAVAAAPTAGAGEGLAGGIAAGAAAPVARALTGEGLAGVEAVAGAGAGGEAAAATIGGTVAAVAAPVAAIAGVLIALKEAFDGMAEDNKKMFSAIGAGGIAGGGYMAMQQARSLLRMPGELGFKYGQTEPRNLEMIQEMIKYGMGTPELFRPGAVKSLKNTFLGEAGVSGLAGVAFGPAMVAGMDTRQASEETMKLIVQYGKSMESVHKFFVMLSADVDASGISTSKYLEIIDDVNSHFSLLTKSLGDVVSVLRTLGSTGMLTGESLKEFSQAFMVPKGAPLPWRAYLLATAPQALKTGMLRGMEANVRTLGGDVYNSLVDALKTTGMTENAAQKELSDKYGIKSGADIESQDASYMTGVISDISGRAGEKGQEYTQAAGTTLETLTTQVAQVIKGRRALAPGGSMKDILEFLPGPQTPGNEMTINLLNALKAVAGTGSDEEAYRRLIAPRQGEERITNQLLASQLAPLGNQKVEEIMKLVGKPLKTAGDLVRQAAEGRLSPILAKDYLPGIAESINKVSKNTEQIDVSQNIDDLGKAVKSRLEKNFALRGEATRGMAVRLDLLSDIANQDSDLNQSNAKDAEDRGNVLQRHNLEQAIGIRDTNDWLEAIWSVLTNQIYWLLSNTLGRALKLFGITPPEMGVDRDTGRVVPKEMGGPHWEPLSKDFAVASGFYSAGGPGAGKAGAGEAGEAGGISTGGAGWWALKNLSGPGALWNTLRFAAGLAGIGGAGAAPTPGIAPAPGAPEPGALVPGTGNSFVDTLLYILSDDFEEAVYKALWDNRDTLWKDAWLPSVHPGGIPAGQAAQQMGGMDKDVFSKVFNVDVRNYQTKTDYHMSDLRTPNGSDIGTSTEITPDKAKKLAVELSNTAIGQASQRGLLPSGFSPVTQH